MTALLTVNEARGRYLDFTVPLYMERVPVSVKRPALEPDVAGFVKPFKATVIYFCLCSLWAHLSPLFLPSVT